MGKEFMVPVLGTEGWLTDVPLGLNYLFGCFLTTDKSQTYVYGDNVASLKHILAVNRSDPRVDIHVEIETELTNMLERYFEVVQVIAFTVPSAETVKTGMLVIDVKVTHGSVTAKLSEQLHLNNGELTTLETALENFNKFL